jgi:hypothetical protein
LVEQANQNATRYGPGGLGVGKSVAVGIGVRVGVGAAAVWVSTRWVGSGVAAGGPVSSLESLPPEVMARQILSLSLRISLMVWSLPYAEARISLIISIASLQ